MRNTEVQYAGLWERFLALLADTLLLCACAFPITRLVKGAWLVSPNGHRWVRGWFALDPLCLTFLSTMMLYFVLLEGLVGATLGKWLLGLRVVRIDGSRPGLWKSAQRNALRLVDSLPTLNVLGAILISRSTERARFGDRVAGTRVIGVRSGGASCRCVMPRKLSPRFRVVLLALLVTLLWSTSWVLIRIGLQDIPPLSFAGLRYTLAFLCLLPFAIHSRQLVPLRRASAGTWLRLALLGLLFYAVTQGAQFLSLFYLPASTASLVLSFTTVLVAFLGVFFLREQPTIAQWAGAVAYLVGVFVYLYPIALPRGEAIGLIAAVIGMLANALSAVLGRYVNRSDELSPLAITVVTMGIGSVPLLAVGIAAQGLPRLTLANWAIVLWLAVVNSALAYTLWNRTLRTLSALESSIINNTMLFQVAVLAWLVLGERLALAEVVGLVLAIVGTLVVQVRRRTTPDRNH